MVERVKSNVYTKANVKHIVCPDCKGSGSILCINLSAPLESRRGCHSIIGVSRLISKRKAKEAGGYYAEVCGRCRGYGWIHKQLGPDEGVSGD